MWSFCFQCPEFISLLQDILTLCNKWKNVLFFKKRKEDCKNSHTCENTGEFYLRLNPSRFWRLKFLICNNLSKFELGTLELNNKKNSRISLSNLNVQGSIKLQKKKEKKSYSKFERIVVKRKFQFSKLWLRKKCFNVFTDLNVWTNFSMFHRYEFLQFLRIEEVRIKRIKYLWKIALEETNAE